MLVQAQVVPWWGTGRPAEFSPSGFHPVTGITRRCVGAKKIVRLHRFFLHQISLESKLNGRQKVKGGNGSISASISTSLIASLITLNLGVGCAPSCWPIFGGAAGAKKNCEIGVGFSFAALSVFRLRRAEAASALWIPHWHSEPCESQGARAAKGWT